MTKLLLSSLPHIQFPPEEVNFLEENVRVQKLAKDSHFFTPGNTCKAIGFVHKGILRSYINQDGRDFIIEFYAEGQFVSAFTSFLTQQPSDWTIQALEDSSITTISHSLLQTLYTRHPCWVALGKAIFEEQTIKKCRREKSLISEDAEKRYFQFREEYANIENRIPQYHIAAYIGIQPETLSRLRKKFAAGFIS